MTAAVAISPDSTTPARQEEVQPAARAPLICQLCGKPETLTEHAGMIFTDFMKHNQVHMDCFLEVQAEAHQTPACAPVRVPNDAHLHLAARETDRARSLSSYTLCLKRWRIRARPMDFRPKDDCQECVRKQEELA